MERRLHPVERLEQAVRLDLQRARRVGEEADVGGFGGVGVGRRAAEIKLGEQQPGAEEAAGKQRLAPGQAAGEQQAGEQHGGDRHHPS